MNQPAGSPDSALREEFLTSRLDLLRGEIAAIEPPAAIEARLVRAFRAKRPAAGRPRLWWMPPLALAATIALASWTMRATIALDPAPAPVHVALAEPGPFLALRPIGALSLEPGATVVATEFPRALLADWGLPVSPERAGESVRAELLYSARGEPLAVRLMP